jgi:DNA-binding MarR family transcriptional regulator
MLPRFRENDVVSKPRMDPIERVLLICDPCLCVQRAARMIARRFDEELRQTGLTNGQFILLMLLNCPKAPGMQDLSSLLAMDRTTLTAALKLLEHRGLVKMNVDRTDRRVKHITLTARARALLQVALPLWNRTRVKVEALVPEGDLDALRRVLRDLPLKPRSSDSRRRTSTR